MATTKPSPSSPAKTAPAAEAGSSLTPAMQQYVDQKRRVGDAILLFRMGDFYETFFDDAKTLAAALGIALTTRGKDNGAIPLAGIPYHALDTYLPRLVQAGYRVAISEQVEDPKLAKGLIKREVVRIVTAGTLVDEALLDERSDNILAAVVIGPAQAGLATVELSSGRFRTVDLPAGDLNDALLRRSAAEVLVNEEVPRDSAADRLLRQAGSSGGCSLTRRPAHEFDLHNAERALLGHFGVVSLEGFGFSRMTPSLQAAGAILAYLKETQKTALDHVAAIQAERPDDVVRIDFNSWRSLEIERTIRGNRREGSLLAAIDRTVHPLGARRLHRWLCQPLRDPLRITTRWDAVGFLAERDSTRRHVREILKQMSDVERIAARIAMARSTPRDLAGLSRTLTKLPDLQCQIGDTCETGLVRAPLLLAELCDALAGLAETADLLQRSIRDDPPPVLREGGVIREGFDAELDRLRTVGSDGQSWLARYQKEQSEATGISNLKVGFNRVFGYYIEISHTQQARVPASYVRKQTVRNAERYITDELKQFENEVLTADEKARDLEAVIFERIRRELAEHIEDLQRVASALGKIDALAGLAELAVRQRYVKPQLADGPCLHITGGRHPVLEQMLESGFVPNDSKLDGDGSRLWIITGPNMAGKSTYIRQVALLTLLAQIGSFVPADAMQFSPVDAIFARVGASDEISRGQSTFMVEMTEAANILNNATARSLVVLDELGRGTSTFDGLALAWAITERLANTTRCLTLMATHYHELTELSELLEGVANYNVAVRENADAASGESIIFLHRIVPGGADKSYGIHVAKLAGVPRPVIARSQEVLEELERSFQRDSKGPHLSKRKSKKDDQQLQLFTDPQEEIARQLAAIDIDQLTPLEALTKLKELKDRIA